MDRTERARLRALCEAATAGPWERQPFGGQWKDDESGTCAIIHKTGQVYSWGEEKKTICNGWMMSRADVDFIAAARTALPAALDALDAMEAKEARLVEHLSRTQKACAIFERNSADVAEMWERVKAAEAERDALQAKLDAAEGKLRAVCCDRDFLQRERDTLCASLDTIRRTTVEAIVRRLRDAAHSRSGGLMDGLFKADTLIEREFLTEKGGMCHGDS